MPLEGRTYGYRFRRLSGFGRGIASPQARILNTALCFNTEPLSEKIQSRCGTLSALAFVCICQGIAADFHTCTYIFIDIRCGPEHSWNSTAQGKREIDRGQTTSTGHFLSSRTSRVKPVSKALQRRLMDSVEFIHGNNALSLGFVANGCPSSRAF